jgi:hypothetical protein
MTNDTLLRLRNRLLNSLTIAQPGGTSTKDSVRDAEATRSSAKRSGSSSVSTAPRIAITLLCDNFPAELPELRSKSASFEEGACDFLALPPAQCRSAPAKLDDLFEKNAFRGSTVLSSSSAPFEIPRRVTTVSVVPSSCRPATQDNFTPPGSPRTPQCSPRRPLRCPDAPKKATRKRSLAHMRPIPFNLPDDDDNPSSSILSPKNQRPC